MSLPRAWVAYRAAAIVAEAALSFTPVGTALIDAAVLVLALSQFGWAQRSPLAIGDPDVRLLPAIALVPLMRLLSLTMPVPELPHVAWIALAGAPLLLTVPATARLVVMDIAEMGLARLSRDRLTVGIVALSVPIGLLVGATTPGDLRLPLDTPLAAGAAALVLVSCAAVPEELIFRGILQPLMVGRLGAGGVLVTGAVSASTYLGTGSAAAVLLVGVMGLAYGWEVARSRSLWAPIVGHSLLVVSAGLVAPILIG